MKAKIEWFVVIFFNQTLCHTLTLHPSLAASNTVFLFKFRNDTSLFICHQYFEISVWHCLEK